MKIVSAVLAVVMLSTNVLFAHKPETSFWAERASQLKIQSHSQPIEVRKSGSDPSNVVYHIQDIHRNLEAQTNIGSIVQDLIKNKNIGLVALEGAFKPLDLEPYRNFPRQESVRRVADYLFKNLKMSGPVHAALTTRGSLPHFVGIDDAQAYEANVAAYRQSLNQFESVKQEWRGEIAKSNAKKQSIFDRSLLEFDRVVESHRESKMEFGTYVRFLANGSSSVNEGVKIFLNALTLEKQLDFSRVESERTHLVSALMSKLNSVEIQELTQATFAYRSGSVRHADFYSYLNRICERKNVSLARFPAMDAYLRYVMMSDQINAESLFTWIQATEKNRYDALCKTDEQKELVLLSRQLYLKGKLIDFSLTNDEWNEYKSIRHPGGSRDPVPQDAFKAAYILDPGLRRGDGSFERFYEEAELRDERMASNLLKQIKSSKNRSAILVTGGFHSKGISERLTKAGYTVIPVTPKISKVETASGHVALSVFAQEKTPLAKLFDGTRLFLSQAPVPQPELLGGSIGFDRLKQNSVGDETARQTLAAQVGADRVSISANGNEADVRITEGAVSSDVKVKLASTGDIQNIEEKPVVAVPPASDAKVKILLADKPANDAEANRQAIEGITQMLVGFGGKVELMPQVGVGKVKEDLAKLLEAERPLVVVVRSATKAFKDPDFLEFAYKCGVRVLIRAGAGVDNIDDKKAKELGISVIRTHGNANSVANTTLRFLIAGLEKLAGLAPEDISPEQDLAHDPEWNKSFDMKLEEFAFGHAESVSSKRGEMTPEQYGNVFHPISAARARLLFQTFGDKTIGLLGAGAIPDVVIKKLIDIRNRVNGSFRIGVASRSIAKAINDNDETFLETWTSRGVVPQKPDDLLKNSDILSLHPPTNSQTKNSINATALAQSNVKLLINTARQELIDPSMWSQIQLSPGVLPFHYFADVDFIYADKAYTERFQQIADAYPLFFHRVPHLAASTPNAIEGVKQNTLSTLDVVSSKLLNQTPRIDYELDIVNGVPVRPESKPIGVMGSLIAAQAAIWFSGFFLFLSYVLSPTFSPVAWRLAIGLSVLVPLFLGQAGFIGAYPYLLKKAGMFWNNVEYDLIYPVAGLSTSNGFLLEVQGDRQYLNRDVKENFRRLPPVLQWIFYAPLAFFRWTHERPGHLAGIDESLHSTFRIPKDATAYSIQYLFVITGATLYALFGTTFSIWVGAIFGALLLLVFNMWAFEDEAVREIPFILVVPMFHGAGVGTDSTDYLKPYRGELDWAANRAHKALRILSLILDGAPYLEIPDGSGKKLPITDYAKIIESVWHGANQTADAYLDMYFNTVQQRMGEFVQSVNGRQHVTGLDFYWKNLFEWALSTGSNLEMEKLHREAWLMVFWARSRLANQILANDQPIDFWNETDRDNFFKGMDDYAHIMAISIRQRNDVLIDQAIRNASQHPFDAGLYIGANHLIYKRLKARAKLLGIEASQAKTGMIQAPEKLEGIAWVMHQIVEKKPMDPEVKQEKYLQELINISYFNLGMDFHSVGEAYPSADEQMAAYKAAAALSARWKSEMIYDWAKLTSDDKNDVLIKWLLKNGTEHEISAILNVPTSAKVFWYGVLQEGFRFLIFVVVPSALDYVGLPIPFSIRLFFIVGYALLFASPRFHADIMIGKDFADPTLRQRSFLFAFALILGLITDPAINPLGTLTIYFLIALGHGIWNVAARRYGWIVAMPFNILVRSLMLKEEVGITLNPLTEATAIFFGVDLVRWKELSNQQGKLIQLANDRDQKEGGTRFQDSLHRLIIYSERTDTDQMLADFSDELKKDPQFEGQEFDSQKAKQAIDFLTSKKTARTIDENPTVSDLDDYFKSAPPIFTQKGQRVMITFSIHPTWSELEQFSNGLLNLRLRDLLVDGADALVARENWAIRLPFVFIKRRPLYVQVVTHAQARPSRVLKNVLEQMNKWKPLMQASQERITEKIAELERIEKFQLPTKIENGMEQIFDRIPWPTFKLDGSPAVKTLAIGERWGTVSKTSNNWLFRVHQEAVYRLNLSREMDSDEPQFQISFSKTKQVLRIWVQGTEYKIERESDPLLAFHWDSTAQRVVLVFESWFATIRKSELAEISNVLKKFDLPVVFLSESDLEKKPSAMTPLMMLSIAFMVGLFSLLLIPFIGTFDGTLAGLFTLYLLGRVGVATNFHRNSEIAKALVLAKKGYAYHALSRILELLSDTPLNLRIEQISGVEAIRLMERSIAEDGGFGLQQELRAETGLPHVSAEVLLPIFTKIASSPTAPPVDLDALLKESETDDRQFIQVVVSGASEKKWEELAEKVLNERKRVDNFVSFIVMNDNLASTMRDRFNHLSHVQIWVRPDVIEGTGEEKRLMVSRLAHEAGGVPLSKVLYPDDLAVDFTGVDDYLDRVYYRAEFIRFSRFLEAVRMPIDLLRSIYHLARQVGTQA